MSTIARASGALGRENVCPRNVDRTVDMFCQQLVALVVEQQQDLRKLSENISIPTTTDTTDSPPKVETLLVGNSLLRDVHFDGPDDKSQIRVVKKSGATFKEIEEMIDEAAKTHKINDIVIVAGTNEPWATRLQTTSATNSAATAYGEISRNIGEGQQRHPNDTANRYTTTKYGE